MMDGGLGAVLAAMAAFAVVGIVIGLALYVYYSLAYMTIARKLNTEPAWLAWIPIANFYLIWKMSRTPVWTIIVAAVSMLLVWVPFLNFVLMLAVGAISLYWLWRIAEQRRYPGWIVLLVLIPVVGGFVSLALPGVLAWVDRK
ncbi:MAG: hypothetical protein ACMXYM_01670 [Candidatus Woesearchaeota archaeon]